MKTARAAVPTSVMAVGCLGPGGWTDSVAPRLMGLCRLVLLSRASPQCHVGRRHERDHKTRIRRPVVNAVTGGDGAIWLEWSARPGVGHRWWVLDAAGEPRRAVLTAGRT